MQTRWGDVRLNDAHVHFFSHRFFATLAAQGGKTAAEAAAVLGWELPAEDPRELAARWVAEFDARGVARACLIASVPGDESSVLAAAAFSERLIPFAMLNPLAAGARVTPGLRAVCLFPAMHGYTMAGEPAGAIVAQAETLGCAVFVHCGVLTIGARKKLGLPSPFDMRFSNPMDLHGVATRHPRVRFVVPHFGAGYLREALMLADLCPNVYLDTSSSNSWMRYEGLDLETVFRRALDVVGFKRVLFGSDSSFFPRGWHGDVFAAQVKALESLGISEPSAAAVFGGNFDNVLGLSGP